MHSNASLLNFDHKAPHLWRIESILLTSVGVKELDAHTSRINSIVIYRLHLELFFMGNSLTIPMKLASKLGF